MAATLHVSMLLYSFLILSFHLSNIALSSSSSSLHPLCHDHERSSLLHFKKSFTISCQSASQNLVSWINNDNVVDNNCCSWHGVECDHNGHVIGLDLSKSCLYGSINPNSSIFELLHLQNLNLAQNNLNFSTIPSSFGKLSRLTNLNLSDSFLSGKIPSEISKLYELTSLDFSNNHKLELKNGDLGGLVGNMMNLKKLHLNKVNLHSKVPKFLSNITSLTSISLDECVLLGELPPSIFKLPNLQSLSLMNNGNLSGELPEFQSSPLEVLRLSSTNLSGTLPSAMGNLGSLKILSLWDCNLHGSIPLSLSNLTDLVHLNLGFNNFIGQFPFWVTNLTKLESLKLHDNNFNGNVFIPTQVTTLFLHYNMFNGSIPSMFSNKTRITNLDLSYNMIEGPIPMALLELNSLSFLDLSYNNLSGNFKLDRFLQLKNLTTLRLSENKLSLHTSDQDQDHVPKFKKLGLSSCNLGKFPNFIKTQDELELLELGHNNISGSIPIWVWNISRDSLLFLNLSSNSLTGFDHPPPLFPWSRLAILDLGSNNLRGSMPYPSPSTTFFSVSNNSLSGELSSLVCDMSSLVVLDLSENNFTGTIPPCLSNSSPSLSILNLRGNGFEGSFPRGWQENSQLKMISLSDNKLSGELPRSLARCEFLECIDVSQNQMNDTFPHWLASLSNLKILLLRSNLFNGEIKSLGRNSSFSNLGIIDLSSNNFTGRLPSDLFLNWNPLKILKVDRLTYLQFNFTFELSNDNVTRMVYYDNYAYSMTIGDKGLLRNYEKIEALLTAVDFSRNKFIGNIPGCISHLEGLHLLNLSRNSLTGEIPPAIADLTDLESLDLSCNKLSGHIPQQLAQLTFLAVFNVSHNNLLGAIPRGKQFDTFDSSSFCGNSGLCGDPLSRRCGYSEFLPPPPPPPSSRSEEDETCDGSLFSCYWKIVVVGYGCGFAIGAVIGNRMFKRVYEWLVRAFGWKKLKFS